MKAARAVLDDAAYMEADGYLPAKQAIHESALAIDTATGLPALIAERDALRAALAGLVKSISDAPSEWFTDECLGIDTEQAYAALALNSKGQP